MFLYLSPPETCREKFVSHRQHLNTQWNESVSGFVKALFNSRQGEYFLVNMLALACFVSGGLVLSGVLQRILQWINTGS
jgi:hypothetical protein